MGLLLVFFPEDHQSSAIVDKNKLFQSPSTSMSSSSSSPSPSSSSSSSSFSLSRSSNSSFRRSNSNNMILTKAQSTISICALLVFITLLLFTLSTFEPTTTRVHHPSSRRSLSQNPPDLINDSDPKFRPNPKINTPNYHGNPLLFSSSSSSWYAKMWKQKTGDSKEKSNNLNLPQSALQGMGTLYRRGTRAMSDLVVGHVGEDVNEDEIRLFMRFLLRSGLAAKADVVLISDSSSRFGSVIREENESFLRLIVHHKQLNRTTTGRRRRTISGFDATQFLKKIGKKEVGEPLWGKRYRSNYNYSDRGEDESELTWFSYGSVLGFETSELDPENTLSGFLDHVSLGLRRWACYPMLLGRVRRNFKHIMLVDVKNLVVLGDPGGRVRNLSPESVLVFKKLETVSGKHGKKNPDKSQSHYPVNSAIIAGGARGIRRLSNAVLTEIVRAAMQHKKKSTVTESEILNQLVSSEFMAKNIKFIKSTESIPDSSSLTGLGTNLDASLSLSEYPVIQRGNSNHDINSIIMKQLCSSEVDSSIYRDC
ncbi:uncharacterized protein LOC107431735 [Ziziphus jujuba]|uniref:Uncharacterized protein LOC107431735 n=1 Tax=Ziziphus jujuba TaxID=326968 RepID=A0A6P4BGM7_ZIZJJ|nr:uncharacterized protein LOC107431735 [Ziziphus jujuba]